MLQKLQRYLLQLGLLSLALAGTAWWLESQQINWLTEKWPALLVVSMLINGGCYVLAVVVLKRFHDNPQAATFGLLAAVSAHLIFYLFFLIAYVLIVGQMDQIFGLNLFAIYTCFLVFELVSLLNILRPLSKRTQKAVLMLFSKFFRFNALSSLLFATLFSLSFSPSRASDAAASTDSTAKEEFNITEMILHHIADAHDWHLFDVTHEDGSVHAVSIPLPVILYTEGNLDVFMSSAFHHGESTVIKGDREYAYDHGHIKELSGKKVLDFSITKNVASMLIGVSLLLIFFIGAARSYSNSVPKGMARFLEPLVLFVRDDIAIPNIGEAKHKKFMPYLLTVFFFIWINNLLGLVPSGANFTGNIAVTLTLAVMTMIITNVSGTKTYWGHIFTPHVPKGLWIIMIPVELIGVISKPFALTVRLFANITAGHIIILSLVSLIFVFKSVFIAPVSVGFVLFMSFLELLVAALQAYVFTLLSALFIGLALEEPHHDHDHAL